MEGTGVMAETEDELELELGLDGVDGEGGCGGEGARGHRGAWGGWRDMGKRGGIWGDMAE